MTGTGVAPSTVERVEYGDDPDLLRQVLAVYRPACRYLKSTSTVAHGEPGDGGHVAVHGAFEIPESFYIQDTGHFNAVEFNLCYNQMIYYILAKAVKEGIMRPLHRWRMADYWARQLPDMFIVDFHSSFRRAMRGRVFSGELDVWRVTERDGGNGPLILLDTKCRYWEDGGGRCQGDVKLVLRNPPGGAANDHAR